MTEQRGSSTHPNSQLAPDQFVSDRIKTLKEAQAKCEEAARVIQKRYPGSYLKWISSTILRVFSRSHEGIATLHVEKLQ